MPASGCDALKRRAGRVLRFAGAEGSAVLPMGWLLCFCPTSFLDESPTGTNECVESTGAWRCTIGFGGHADIEKGMTEGLRGLS